MIGYRLLGVAGAATLAGAGLAAGALPVGGSALWLADWRSRALPAVLCGYFGLTLMVAAWVWAGRHGREQGGPGQRSLLVTLAVWSLPLVAGPPLFSRDAYAYLAQGAMVVADIDVYKFGVARLGGGLAAQVPQMWQQTPTPYGPVFLGLAAAIAGVAGAKVVAGVAGLRLVALAGVGLMVAYLPRLARQCGVDPASALWLGALNPLVPLHLIAGAHNEAVMLGLLVAGLHFALDRRFALGVVLVTLAALVKAPAAAGLAVVAAVWWQRSSGRTRHLVAVARTAGIAAATTVAVTGLIGTGFGWVSSLSTPISPHSWSLSSAAGRASRAVLQAIGTAADGEASMRFWAWCGIAAAVAIAAFSWWRRDRLGPVYAIGLGLCALALLGPATRPWYALWGLVPIAAAAPHGAVRRWAAVGCGVLAFLVLPSGFGPDAIQFAYASAGVALAVAVVAYGRLWARALAAHRAPGELRW